MFYKKMRITAFFLALLFFGLPFSSSFAAMTGGTYNIFADTFSATDDSAAATGGTYSLRSNAGEFAAGILQSSASGTIAVNGDGIFIFNETFYLSDGFASRTFRFFNLMGGGNGTVDVDGAVFVDIGGPGGFWASDLAIRIRDAINDPDAYLSIGATALGNTVTLVNSLGGADGNVPITEEVASADFVVAGMTGGGGTYTLRGGFQAMEKTVLSMSFTMIQPTTI